MSNSNFKNITFILVLLCLVSITFIYVAFYRNNDLPTYVDLYRTTHEED